MLEALRSTNGLVQVILYAPPGTTNVFQTTDTLPKQTAWPLWLQVIPTNLFQPLPPVPATNGTLFIRAVRQ